MTHPATILLIEDDERLGRSLVRMMKAGGYDVVHALTGEAAIENVMKRSFDMILSDLNLPDSCGVDILKIARAQDPDVPLMLMSGCPTIDTTIEAVNLGVLEYLVKPMSRERLAGALRRGTTGHRKARRARRLRGGARRSSPCAGDSTSASSQLEARFERAMSSLAVELEPVAESWKVIGFAPHVWSAEESLVEEPALVAAAERLGRIRELRQRGLALALAAFRHAPADALLFVEVDLSELDAAVCSRDRMLALVADRVVFQVRGGGARESGILGSDLQIAKLSPDLADLDAID